VRFLSCGIGRLLGKDGKVGGISTDKAPQEGGELNASAYWFDNEDGGKGRREGSGLGDNSANLAGRVGNDQLVRGLEDNMVADIDLTVVKGRALLVGDGRWVGQQGRTRKSGVSYFGGVLLAGIRRQHVSEVGQIGGTKYKVKLNVPSMIYDADEAACYRTSVGGNADFDLVVRVEHIFGREDKHGSSLS
jgi:hypothetical protein